MMTDQMLQGPEVAANEWVTFPGGELEGRRPKVMCPACRERLRARLRRGTADAAQARPPVCFECYRVDQARERALKAARDLLTASDDRFSMTMPFEPVNRPRLERLQAERAAARARMQSEPGRFVDRRRRAQLEARRALQRVAAGPGLQLPDGCDRDAAVAGAIHAAELQLPAAWLPFVVSSS